MIARAAAPTALVEAAPDAPISGSCVSSGLRFEFGHNYADWHFGHPRRWDDRIFLSRLIERLCYLLFLILDNRIAYHKGKLLGRFDLRCLNRHIGVDGWRIQFIRRDLHYCRH